jgi:hypothetical protein
MILIVFSSLAASRDPFVEECFGFGEDHSLLNPAPTGNNVAVAVIVAFSVNRISFVGFRRPSERDAVSLLVLCNLDCFHVVV